MGAATRSRGSSRGRRRCLAVRARRRSGRSTLYLHGLGFGEWFWHFNSRHPAQATTTRLPQAEAGSRLGDDRPSRLRRERASRGHRSCLGGQASIAHQVIAHLRKGSYSVAGGKALRFKQVALVGHSIGAQIAMIEAYSFKDVNALGVVSFSFQNLPRAQLALGPTRDPCLAGGEPAEPGGPRATPTSASRRCGLPVDHVPAHRRRCRRGAFATATPAATSTRSSPRCSSSRRSCRTSGCPCWSSAGPGTRSTLRSAASRRAERFTRQPARRRSSSVRDAVTRSRSSAAQRRFRRKVSRWLKQRGF